MARSKSDLISRQELLELIHAQAEAIKDTDPCQHAVLAYWQTVVEALPGKAVVEVQHCENCSNWRTDIPGETADLCLCDLLEGYTYPCDFCSFGESRDGHGKE